MSFKNSIALLYQNGFIKSMDLPSAFYLKLPGVSISGASAEDEIEAHICLHIRVEWRRGAGKRMNVHT